MKFKCARCGGPAPCLYHSTAGAVLAALLRNNQEHVKAFLKDQGFRLSKTPAPK